MNSTATESTWDRDRRSIWHPYTRHSALAGEPFPVIARGEGIYLYDEQGNRYLDAVSSWWACNLGHSHPRLVEAISRQSRELQHSILGNLSHAPAAELAGELVELFPDRHRRILFASDGASAIEAALRIAVQYWHNVGKPERCRFAAFENAYHGDTFGAMALGYLPEFHAPYRQVLFPVHQVAVPECSTCSQNESAEACDLRCLALLEGLFEEHGKTLAAMVVEPLCQGAGGMRIYPAAYLRRLGDLCRKHDILLIVDEIAMGYGRTGRMFAFEHAGLDPDIVCLGKSLSGGYLPMSAAVVKEEIFATFGDEVEDHTFYHGHTFAGNPIAAAAAIECLHIYREEGIVERAQRLGRILGEQMESFRDQQGVTNIRSLGMIGVFELEDTGTESGSERAKRLRRRLMDEGILIRPLGNIIYLMPPLIIDERVLLDVVEALRRGVAEV